MSEKNLDVLFEEHLANSRLPEKQQAVLRASLQLFATKGFDRTTTGDIAKSAGVAEGTVYRHFQTKQAILQALLQPFVEQVIPVAGKEFAEAVTAGNFAHFDAFVRYIFTDRLHFALANTHLVMLFLKSAVERPAILQGALAEVDHNVVGELTALIARFQAQGEVYDWPAAEIIRYLIAVLASNVLPVLFEATETIDVEVAVEHAVTLITQGLRPR